MRNLIEYIAKEYPRAIIDYEYGSNAYPLELSFYQYKIEDTEKELKELGIYEDYKNLIDEYKEIESKFEETYTKEDEQDGIKFTYSFRFKKSTYFNSYETIINLPNVIKRKTKNNPSIKLNDEKRREIVDKIYEFKFNLENKQRNILDFLSKIIALYKQVNYLNLNEEILQYIIDVVIPYEKYRNTDILKGFKGFENLNVYKRKDDGFGHEIVIYPEVDYKNKEIKIAMGSSDD